MSAVFWGACSTPSPGRFDPKDEIMYPVLQMDGWAPGSAWTGVEKR